MRRVIHPAIRCVFWLLIFPMFLRADPATATGLFLIGLAISAASAAAEAGLSYLLAQRQKAAPIDRGKIDDIRISTSEFGATIPRGWGIFRLAPNWFFHTPIVDTPVTSGGGGGGGKSFSAPPTPQITDHVYTTTLAGSFHDGPIVGVRRIWFDTDLVWNTTADSANTYEAEAGTLAGGAHSVVSTGCSGGHRVSGIGSGGTCTIHGINATSGAGEYEIAIQYTSASDLTLYYSVNGASAIPVFLPSSGGVTFPATDVVTVTLNPGSSNTIAFSNAGDDAPDLDMIQVAAVITYDPVDPRDPRNFTGLVNPEWGYSQNQDAVWPSYNYTPVATTNTVSANLSKYGQAQIRIYLGTETQTPDAAIVAAKGVGNASAYRGTACIVIENLQLNNGRVPNVTLEIDQGTTDLAQIVEDHYTAVEVDSSNLDLSELSGITITGWVLTSRQTAAKSLQDLQTAYQFDLPEVDGMVYATWRDNTSSGTIPYTDLRAHIYGDTMPGADMQVTDTDIALLPQTFDVNYLDPALDYHNNTQHDLEIVATGAQDFATASLPWVASADEAKALAITLRTKPFMEGRLFEFIASSKYLKYYPGKVVTITTPTLTQDVRITQMDIDLPPGLVSFKACRVHPGLYNPNANATSTGFESPIVKAPGSSKFVILDGPLLRAEDAGDGTQPVYYIAVCGRGSGVWPGAFEYVERPIGSGNYELVTSFTQQASIGTSRTGLGTVTDASVWDRVNSVTVDFWNNATLSSVTEAELLANPELNLIGVTNSTGVEYVQFSTATPISASSGFQTAYTLSGFLRGRAGTDNLVGVHASADDVVLMDSNVKPRRYSLADIGA